MIGRRSSQLSWQYAVNIQRYCSISWFQCSDKPSAWGWYAVVGLGLIPIPLYILCMYWDVNWGPQSMIISVAQMAWGWRKEENVLFEGQIIISYCCLKNDEHHFIRLFLGGGLICSKLCTVIMNSTEKPVWGNVMKLQKLEKIVYKFFDHTMCTIRLKHRGHWMICGSKTAGEPQILQCPLC